MAWNGSGGASAPIGSKASAKKPSPWRGLVAGAVVVVLAAVGAYVLLCKSGSPISDDESVEERRIKVHQPAKVKTTHTPTESISNKVPRSETSGAKTSEKTALPEATEDVSADTEASAENKKPKDTRVFKNAMDQLLSMVVPREAGDSVPPVPIDDNMVFSEEDEKKILERLTAEENDSEALLERKELVQAMRDEYQEMKKRGWTFVDYIKALEAKARLDTEVLQESQKIHDTIFDDPEITDKEYQETLEKINKVLGDRGIKPIKPPFDEEENEQ